MKVIFLDIDGCLNDHAFCDLAKSSTLKRPCVDQLNRVLAATGARIVLSSAWRYMILGGAMTTTGFEYMLRTHGLDAAGRIVGITAPDEKIRERDDQIRAWLARNEVESYAVLDDLHLGMPERHVRPDGKCGLTPELADRMIELLST